MAEAGFEVDVVVADGKGNEQTPAFRIHDVGASSGRIKRIAVTTRKVLKKAIDIDADVYHFHDPELLLTGKKLLKKGKKVIYDVHEDVPRQILSKHWINKSIRKIISAVTEKFEDSISKKLDLILTATPFIRERFLKINQNVIDVNNFPVLDPDKNIFDRTVKSKNICYIGSLAKVRGVSELVNAMSNMEDFTLHLGGKFSPPDYRDEVTNIPGWKKVKEYGFVDRETAVQIMAGSLAGMVTLHPIINYIDALPVKLFEYMSAGLPVIASDFPLWKDIVEKNKCGICVDPLDPVKIADAVTYLFENPDVAKEMGGNGLNTVYKKYNWETEKRKLIDAYRKLFEKK